MDIHCLELSSGGFTTPCMFILGGGYSGGELLGSSSCSVERSALMFCSMVLCDGGALLGYLLPGLAGLGAWFICLVEVARNLC